MYICLNCYGMFNRAAPVQYCSVKCEKAQRGEDLPKLLHNFCYRCEHIFYFVGMYNEEVCYDCCKEITEEYFQPIPLVDYYVYEWLDGEEVFYIGKGSGSRAWDKHNETPSQERRDAAKRFSVRIVRHGMPEDQAFFLEGSLMLLRKMEGHPLVNRMLPPIRYSARHLQGPQDYKQEIFFTF